MSNEQESTKSTYEQETGTGEAALRQKRPTRQYNGMHSARVGTTRPSEGMPLCYPEGPGGGGEGGPRRDDGGEARNDPTTPSRTITGGAGAGNPSGKRAAARTKNIFQDMGRAEGGGPGGKTATDAVG